MSVAPDKIIEAVKKMGGSAEMANDLVEAVQSYVSESEQANQTKFKNILNKAKALCVEYVEQEILKNSRKLQVYIESKEREFSEFAERSRKLEESQAAAQLKKISSVLNNGTTEVGSEVSVQLESLQKSQERLEKAYMALKEENARLSTASSRANVIAERAIHKAKSYRSLLAKAGLAESKYEESQEEGGEEEGGEEGSMKEGGAQLPHPPEEVRLRRGGRRSGGEHTSSISPEDLEKLNPQHANPPPHLALEGRNRRNMRMIGESRVRSQRPVTSSPMVGGPSPIQQSSDPVVNQIARNIATDL